jgi:Ran GTPase-activating protein (RanGAP) involved in mRNA processing and transport
LITHALTKDSKLTDLNISNNNLDDEFALPLSEVLPVLSTLSTLNLSMTMLGTKTATAFAKTLPKSHLTALNLDHNTFGDMGLSKLVPVLASTSLTSLSLVNNDIQSDGVQSLIDVIPKTRLRSLSLERNSMTTEQKTELSRLFSSRA